MKVKLLILLAAALSACSECRYADCRTKYDGIRFSLLSKNGKDLLNGDTKKYNRKDLGLFSFDDQGKKVYSRIYVNLETKGPAVVEAVLGSDKESYLELHNSVTDTLKFEFAAKTSECCGNFSQLTKVYLNKKLICDDNSLFEIKERP